MHLRLIILFLSVSFAQAVTAQTKATTDDGKRVLLYDNGTWRPYEDSLEAPLVFYSKPPGAKTSVEGKEVLYRHFFDKSLWQTDITAVDDVKEHAFSLKQAFVFAMIIPEYVMMEMPFLRAAAFDNARTASKDMRIISEEQCIVNGYRADKVIMKGTVDGKAYTYYCLYYAGSRGVVQVITYCSTPLFEQHKQHMEDFLHGFTLIND
jgi:hypothetical protein